MNDLSGSSFGRYHLVEKLGEGGMAVVYKAFDTRLECDVAVKVIRMDNLPRSSEEVALKRFEREAKAVAQLTHPNIVRVMDFGEEDGLPYLVMPFLPGGTLKQYLGKPMPYAEAAHLLQPVADALAYAHLHNVVHRDVKPSNILITELGQPMLTDFGIAKIMDLQDGQTLTGTGVGIGTPEYMAPEQWTGKITPAVDIYSLGVVFYELVTGHKPYTADTPAAVFLKTVNDPLPKPSSIIEELPEGVENTLYKALAKKPEDRYSGIREFATRLQNLGIQNSENKKPAEVLPDLPPQLHVDELLTRVEVAPDLKTKSPISPALPAEDNQVTKIDSRVDHTVFSLSATIIWFLSVIGGYFIISPLSHYLDLNYFVSVALGFGIASLVGSLVFNAVSTKVLGYKLNYKALICLSWVVSMTGGAFFGRWAYEEVFGNIVAFEIGGAISGVISGLSMYYIINNQVKFEKPVWFLFYWAVACFLSMILVWNLYH